MFRKYLLIVVLFAVHTTQAELLDSTHQTKRFISVFKTPLVLIGAGLYSKDCNNVFSRFRIQGERNHNYRNFKTNIDDYIQYAPIVAVYTLDLAGIDAKHDIKERTKLLLKSELLMAAMVCPLKKFTREVRPDGAGYRSFPSGHTAQAFVAATFLHKEYGEEYPWISVGGYLCASTVGFCRVLNNKHWFSDVLVGAGIGILSTNIVYYLYEEKEQKKNKRTTAIPTFSSNDNSFGMYFAYKLTK